MIWGEYSPPEDAEEVDVIRVEHHYEVTGRSVYSVVRLTGVSAWRSPPWPPTLDCTSTVLHECYALREANEVCQRIGRVLGLPASWLVWPEATNPPDVPIGDEECPF